MRFDFENAYADVFCFDCGTEVKEYHAMIHLVKTAVGKAGLHIAHQIHPQGNLSAIEGCLLDDALGTIGHIGHNHLISLICRIAQKIALKHGMRVGPLLE